MDPWEFAFWLHLVNLEELDILRVRERTGLGGYLKYDHLLIYVALNLKDHLKYHHDYMQPQQQRSVTALATDNTLNYVT